MGGYGSGGWNFKGSPCVEDCFRITINSLLRSGLLLSGYSGIVRGRDSSVSVVASHQDGITLKWELKGTTESRSLFVGVQSCTQPRHFGGYQKYFVCPRCQRLTTSVYFFNSTFLCRICQKLSYASQRERELERAKRKIGKLQIKVGLFPEPEFWDIPPRRPKSMKLSTYEPLMKKWTMLTRTIQSLETIKSDLSSVALRKRFD